MSGQTPKRPFVFKRARKQPAEINPESKLKRKGPSMTTRMCRRLAAGGFLVFLAVVIIALVIAIVLRGNACDKEMKQAGNFYKAPEAVNGCDSYESCLKCSRKACPRVVYKIDVYAAVTGLNKEGAIIDIFMTGEHPEAFVNLTLWNTGNGLMGTCVCQDPEHLKMNNVTREIETKFLDDNTEIYVQYYPRYIGIQGPLFIWPRVVLKGKKELDLQFWEGTPCAFFIPSKVTTKANGAATISKLQGGITEA